MDWSPVLLVLATGAVSFGVAWINGLMTARNERMKMLEEDKRESKKLERDLSAASQSASAEAEDAEAARAKIVAESF
jgi:hypothetical protein